MSLGETPVSIHQFANEHPKKTWYLEVSFRHGAPVIQVTDDHDKKHWNLWRLGIPHDLRAPHYRCSPQKKLAPRPKCSGCLACQCAPYPVPISRNQAGETCGKSLKHWEKVMGLVNKLWKIRILQHIFNKQNCVTIQDVQTSSKMMKHIVMQPSIKGI
jgi:hypothetical protein